MTHSVDIHGRHAPRLITRLLVAVLLMIASAAAYRTARVAESLAARAERTATLQSPDIDTASNWRTVLEGWLDPVSTGEAVRGDYWRGRFDRVRPTSETSAGDAAALLVAAHAEFRKAQREAAGGLPGPERLDQVVQAYASVLKNGGFNREAAYNYEYVARLRDVVARARPAGKPAAPPRPATNDDLPTGPTLHGRPGRHPPDSKGEEFEIITPLDYGDREAQPEPTPGRPLPRKGE